LVHFDEAYDIAVLEVGECRHFCVDELLEGLIRVDDLDSVASSSCVFRELDLAGDATSKRSSKCVLIKSSWHLCALFDF